MEGAKQSPAWDLEPGQRKERVCLGLSSAEGWSPVGWQGHPKRGAACHGVSEPEWALEGVLWDCDLAGLLEPEQGPGSMHTGDASTGNQVEYAGAQEG